MGGYNNYGAFTQWNCTHPKICFTLWYSKSGSGEHHPKWNKPVRERQVPCDFTLMRNIVKWTKKENRDRLIDGEQMTVEGRSWGVEGLSRKEKGLMDMDNSVVIASARRV